MYTLRFSYELIVNLLVPCQAGIKLLIFHVGYSKDHYATGTQPVSVNEGEVLT